VKGYSWADACNDAIRDREFWLMIGGTESGSVPKGTLVFASRVLRAEQTWIVADDLVHACDKADPDGFMNYSRVAALIRYAPRVEGFDAAARRGPVRIEVRP
jgi:hypothetical protein